MKKSQGTFWGILALIMSLRVKVQWIALVWGVFLWGQGLSSPQLLPPRPVIKFMPLALIDPFQYTLHGGVEVPISSTNSLQVEGGWVFGHLGETMGEEDYSQRGFKTRLSWREYFERKIPKNRSSYILEGAYFSLSSAYQRYMQTIAIDTSGGAGYYQEYARVIQAFELSFLLGYQTQIGKRLSIDVWAGMGVRYSTHSWSPTRPPGSWLGYHFTPIGNSILRPGGRPVPRMGFALGWILK